MIHVFLAGEGPNDIGDWCRHQSYREDPPRPSVEEVLMRKTKADGWEVHEGIRWASIRKYRPNRPGAHEVRNVLGAALMAREEGCDVLAFVRDRDGSHANPNHQRERDIELGIETAVETHGDALRIAGGVAIKKLESWLVALAGRRGSEQERRPEEILESLGVHEKNTREMVEFAEGSDLDDIPDDAESLLLWRDRVKKALDPTTDTE